MDLLLLTSTDGILPWTQYVINVAVVWSLYFTFNLRNDTARRSFYIASHKDDCETDLGWLTVIEPGSTMCTYDRILGRERMKPAILFAQQAEPQRLHMGKYLHPVSNACLESIVVFLYSVFDKINVKYFHDTVMEGFMSCDMLKSSVRATILTCWLLQMRMHNPHSCLNLYW